MLVDVSFFIRTAEDSLHTLQVWLFPGCEHAVLQASVSRQGFCTKLSDILMITTGIGVCHNKKCLFALYILLA